MCSPTWSRSESIPSPSRALKSPAMNSDVFFAVAVGLDVFVHLLDVRVCVSRVGEVHTGQFVLALIAHECCRDHPFADVLCLNDLSFSSLYSNSVHLSEATSANFDGHILMSRSLFVRVFHVSHRRTASHLHPSSSVRSSSNRSPLFKHLAFFVSRQRVSQGDFPSFLLLLLCLPFFRVAVVVVVLVVRVVVAAVCVLLMCLCCKMIIGRSPYAVENATRPPPAVSLARQLVVMPSSCFTLSFW